MNIRITVGDQHVRATLFDSAAGRDLIVQPPLTIDMIDHGGQKAAGRIGAVTAVDAA